MRLDYHVHLAVDSYQDPLCLEEQVIGSYVNQARARGIEEIAITEHCYRFREFAPVLQHISHDSQAFPQVRQFMAGCFVDSLASYTTFLMRLRHQGLPIKVGLEVDYVPGRESAIRQALGDYSWDYILGSVHFLGSWPTDAGPSLGWADRDIYTTYTEYFDTWGQACASGLFDSMAHPDLLKKFGHRPAEPPRSLFAGAARQAKRAGVAIEVNSAGLRKPVGEVYPGYELLRAFLAEGVPISLGSDAHSACEVGLDVDRAISWAMAAGYRTVTRFSRRQATQEPLG